MGHNILITVPSCLAVRAAAPEHVATNERLAIDLHQRETLKKSCAGPVRSTPKLERRANQVGW
jgi:hypothetical protein